MIEQVMRCTKCGKIIDKGYVVVLDVNTPDGFRESVDDNLLDMECEIVEDIHLCRDCAGHVLTKAAEYSKVKTGTFEEKETISFLSKQIADLKGDLAKALELVEESKKVAQSVNKDVTKVCEKVDKVKETVKKVSKEAKEVSKTNDANKEKLKNLSIDINYVNKKRVPVKTGKVVEKGKNTRGVGVANPILTPKKLVECQLKAMNNQEIAKQFGITVAQVESAKVRYNLNNQKEVDEWISKHNDVEYDI